MTEISPDKLNVPKLGLEEGEEDSEELTPMDEEDLNQVVRVSIFLEAPSTISAGFSTEGIGTNSAAIAYRDGLKNQQAEPKSVYYVVGFGPSGNFTAGGNSFINEIISIAGGRNVAADITGWSYSLEALMQADPDYIMIRREDSATFCTTPPYNRLTAIKKNQIIAIESGTIDLQVPRNIDAIRFISQQLSR
jgi:hypothetical protein